MKTHLYRSNHSTWCGRRIVSENAFTGDGSIPSSYATRNHNGADCRTCLKANAAEQRKENASS